MRSLTVIVLAAVIAAPALAQMPPCYPYTCAPEAANKTNTTSKTISQELPTPAPTTATPYPTTAWPTTPPPTTQSSGTTTTTTTQASANTTTAAPSLTTTASSTTTTASSTTTTAPATTTTTRSSGTETTAAPTTTSSGSTGDTTTTTTTTESSARTTSAPSSGTATTTTNAASETAQASTTTAGGSGTTAAPTTDAGTGTTTTTTTPAPTTTTPAPTPAPPCVWPVTGWPACDRCWDAATYFDPATRTCMSCQPSTPRILHVVPHGETSLVPYTLGASQCWTGRRITYYGGYFGQRWFQLYTDFTAGGFSLSQYCDENPSNVYPGQYRYTPMYNSVNMIGAQNSYAWIGSVLCAPPVRVSAVAGMPSSVHLHVITASAKTATTFVSTVGALRSLNIAVTASFGWTTAAATTTAVTSTTHAASLINTALATLTSAYPYYYGHAEAARCALFDDATRTLASELTGNTAGSVLIVGEGSATCDTVFNDLAAVVRGGKRVGWAAEAAPELRFVTPLATPSNEFATAFAAALQAFLAPRGGAAINCDGGITLPESVEAYAREAMPVVGACNVSRCCVGNKCSRFTDHSGTPSCVVPLLKQTDVAQPVVVVTDGGIKNGTVKVSQSQSWTRGVSAWRQTTWRRLNINDDWHFRTDYAGLNVTVWRSNAAVECCRWVGIGFDRQVLGAFHGNETFCFNKTAPENAGMSPYYWYYGYGHYARMMLPIPEEPADTLFSVPVRTVALQCGAVKTEDTTLTDGASFTMTHDTFGGASPPPAPTRRPSVSDGHRSKSNSDSASGSGSGSGSSSSARRAKTQKGVRELLQTTALSVTNTVPLNHINARRVESFITRALELQQTTSTGNAMRHVRLALGAANLHSTIAGHWRACGLTDLPDRNGECRYPWSATAAGAGPFLESAGFTAVSTTWDLQGVQRGDVVVFPAVSIAGTDYASGTIAIALDTAGTFVSDIVHGRNVFPGLVDALLRGRAIVGGNPTIYRLEGIVEEHPMTRESLIPVPAVKEVTSDTETYCRAFNAHDNGEKASYWQTAVNYINAHYRCPAVLDRFTRPREFGGAFAVGVNLGSTVQCFEVSPWWLRTRPSEHGSGVRCCYHLNNTYIPTWPSRVTFTDMNEWQWARTDEGEAERTCCGAGDAVTVASQACLAFRDRRPAPLPTNAPFLTPMLWFPRRRRAGGWGDPHCSTYDGFDFECNFHGEAVWSRCGAEWSVHAVAEPVGTGRATAITKFAVNANGTTVIGEITATANDAGDFWRVLVDEQEVTEDFVSASVVVTFSNQTVTVIDASGNEAEATFARSLITLTTAPAEACRGSATGLCGNFNGDASDDLRPSATAAVVSVNATSETIYDDFVLTQLVTDASASLFPATMGVVTNATYRPTFITADVLAGCPAACNGDRACCFDAAVGGSEFATEFTTSQETMTRGNRDTVGLNENLPPAFTASTEVFEYNASAVDASADAAVVNYASYTVTDVDNVASLDCTICTTAGVTCAKTGLGTARATLAVSGPAPTQSGAFTCTATDALGATAQAATTILAIGETSGLGFVTNPPTPAPKPIAPVSVGAGPTGGNDNGAGPAADDSSDAGTDANRDQTLLIVGVCVAAAVVVAALGGIVAFVVTRPKTADLDGAPKTVEETMPPARATAYTPRRMSISVKSNAEADDNALNETNEV